MTGHFTVINRRMEALKAAINDRDPIQTEFTYDQVLRAIHKLEREADDRLDRVRAVASWLINNGDAVVQHVAMLIMDALDTDPTVTAEQIVSRDRRI
jgi:acyl-CoA synthetase (AMP-forming)/AMP-acid ligase II